MSRMTPKACWLKSFYFTTFSSFSEFSDFKFTFVSYCMFRIENVLHEATYQCVGITYRPKTENWFPKSPLRIEHILEYNMLMQYCIITFGKMHYFICIIFFSFLQDLWSNPDFLRILIILNYKLSLVIHLIQVFWSFLLPKFILAPYSS